MQFTQSPLAGLWEIEVSPNGDDRGHFTRLFCSESFAVVRRDLRFVQCNLSLTTRSGTIRGLHFQHSPAAEAKLIRCIAGAVFDVAVDLRRESPTFGKWHGVQLSAVNGRQIFIPEGFAHGFQALSDNAQLLYQHTALHTPGCESGLLYSDPHLAIEWPLPVTTVSSRDAGLPCLTVAAAGFVA